MVTSVAIGASVMVAVGRLGGDIAERVRAQTAADAAALAGVVEGRGAAERLAARHGATLVRWSDDGSVVTVEVRLGDAVVTARATDDP
jgi:outer membrane lipoprotein SlyB